MPTSTPSRDTWWSGPTARDRIGNSNNFIRFTLKGDTNAQAKAGRRVIAAVRGSRGQRNNPADVTTVSAAVELAVY
ncbi:MAG: hypothetical protein WBZ37_06425 [Mycobacterium sp.]